ncbi:MAG: S8 family serine peptidase [bacterium]
MRQLPSVGVLLVIFFVVGGIVGCDRGPDSLTTPVEQPAGATQIQELDPIPYGLKPNEDEWVVLLDPTIDIEDLADDAGASVVGAAGYSGVNLALLAAPGAVPDLNQPGVVAYVQNTGVNLSTEGASLVIGFIGGNFTETNVRAQNALACLELPVLHTHAKGDGMKIGVVDTGARLDHVAFAGRLEILEGHRLKSGELLGNGLDDDGDGDVDEGLGHGTFVAGMVALVAPGATILPVKVLDDDGYGSMLGVVEGILVCRERGCDVINLSLVLSAYSSEFEKLLAQLSQEGIAITAAAGNDGISNPFYPATSEYTVGVTAVTGDDVMPTYAAGGSDIWFAAPGHRVVSAGVWSPDAMAVGAGTSMATPVVSAAVVLVREAQACGAAEAIGHLGATCAPTTPLHAIGRGRIAPVAACTD